MCSAGGTSWRALKHTGEGYDNTNNDHRQALKDKSAPTFTKNTVFCPDLLNYS